VGDVSGAAAGTWYTVILTALITGAGGVAKHWVTEHFKRRAKEIDLLADREKEVEATIAAAPFKAEIYRLEAELNRERERAARAEFAAAENASDLEGLGEDMRRLAADKALAEQERDAALKKAAEAESEAEEWKRLLTAAEVRAGRTRSPAKETYVEKPSGEPRNPRGAPKPPGDRPDGGHPTDRPLRPKGRTEGG
jgi:chromosome segregation ATPase